MKLYAIKVLRLLNVMCAVTAAGNASRCHAMLLTIFRNGIFLFPRMSRGMEGVELFDGLSEIKRVV